MYGNNWNNANIGNFFGGAIGAWIGTFMIPLLLWSIFWKGWALWKAAKADSKAWFVILLILNTAGILDIIYIFIVSKQAKSSKRK